MINNSTASSLIQQSPFYKGSTNPQIDNQTSQSTTGTGASLPHGAGLRAVNDNILKHLNEVLQQNGLRPVKTIDSSDFTPDAVANRILDFAQNALKKAGQQGQDVTSVLDQIKSGIDKGFKDAKDILQGLNALSGSVADNINSTYQKIQDGLQNILNNAQSNNNSNVIQATQYFSQTQQSSQSLDLQITTQEGDTIKVNLSRDEKTGKYTAQIQNASGSAEVSQQTHELNQNFSLSVKGDISDAELSAVKDLLTGVKGVADQFFNGNSQAALQAGLNLGYDTSTIASFSLNLNENKTSTVTKAYQEVSALNDNTNTGQNNSQTALNNILKPINGFLNSLHSVINNANNSPVISNPKSNIEDLLNYFSNSDHHKQHAINNLQAKAGAPFKNIVHDFISKL